MRFSFNIINSRVPLADNIDVDLGVSTTNDEIVQ